jgi:predicted Zn-dependent protease with MMP-like domain
VRRALAGLPDEIRAALDNVEVVIEDEPRADQLTGSDSAELFGLYEGLPLTARGSGYTLTLPDKITIFRGPLERACETASELEHEVRTTVLHELGHHFGFEEDRLEELGLA